MRRKAPLFFLGFFVFGLSQVVCVAGDLVVRAYRAELGNFGYDAATDTGELPEEKRGEIYEGVRLEEAPFESRFFVEGDGLLGFTEWGKACGLLDHGEAKAVFNERSGRLVVRAELRDHYFLKDYLEQFLEGQIWFEFRLVKMPGVELGRMDLGLAKIERDGEELARVAGLSRSGSSFELRTPGGELVWEGDCQAGFPDTSWECQSLLRSQIPGAKFDFRTGLAGVMGVPVVIELGSFRGKATLVGIWKASQVLLDGSDVDDWVQAETLENVVMAERVRGWLHKDKKWVALENGKRYQVFHVPPTFWTFFGGDGKSGSLRELLRKDGVSLGDDDRLLLFENGTDFAVEASPLNVELIEGITMAAGQDGDAGILGGSYSLVESDEKLRIGGLEKGGFRILRKICVGGYGGQSVTMRMRRRFLEIESESQASFDDDFVETRVTLKARGKVVLATAAEAEVGKPVILHQERVGEKWRSWVVTFSARYFADTIEEGR